MLAGAAITAVFAAKSDFSDNSRVKEYKAKIDALEKEQKDIKNRLEDVKNERYSAQQQSADIAKLITSTNEQIATTELLLGDIESQIAVKEGEIADTEEQITVKEGEIADTKEKFLELLRVQYEKGSPSLLEIVYDADGLSDMLSRVQYMGSIMDYNSNLLDKYSSQHDDLLVLKSDLEEDKASLEEDHATQLAYEQELETKKSELEYQKGVQDKLITSLIMSEEEIQAEYDAAIKAEQEENARLEKYLAQLAAEAAKKNSKFNSTTGDNDTGGKLGWPVSKSIKYISSYYGWRTYYYRGRKVTDFHMGIDIPAAVGTDIYASDGGKVILAQWHYSYGNYMIVDHGGGITTLYAHCTKLLKGVGDVVKRGEHIAEMGSTGNSTGSHLHFEVRVNGKHTNPLLNGWIVQPK